MSKEKILEILENAKDGNGDVPMRLVRTAFDKLSEPCEDTISRQAAIDVVRQYCIDNQIEDGDYHSNGIEYELNNLPSAQPDNQTNLCDSCDYSYPDCPSKNDDMIFGNGIGNDNICACNKYKPPAQPEEFEWCHDCKEYDQTEHCCHRWTKVIRETVKEIKDAQPEQRWIPCNEQLPDNRVSVIVCYREWQQYAKRYIYSIVIGWYARKHNVRENVFSEWEADCDYDEDEDEFYIHEGWYEFTTQGNADLMNWYINAEVVAWMPLPEPYVEGGTDG